MCQCLWMDGSRLFVQNKYFRGRPFECKCVRVRHIDCSWDRASFSSSSSLFLLEHLPPPSTQQACSPLFYTMMQTAIQHLPSIHPHHNPHSSHPHIQHRHNNVNIPTPPQYSSRQLPISSSAASISHPATSAASSAGGPSSHHKPAHLALQPLQLPLPMPTPHAHSLAQAQNHVAGPVTRKRKRPSTQVSVTYSEVQEFDHEGRMREVIVIEDTPPPPTTATTSTTTLSPSVASIATTHAAGHGYSNSLSLSYQPPVFHAPIRTRARAAAEANAANAANAIANAYTSMLASTSNAAAGPATKKRKRDPVDDGLQSQHLPQVPTKKIVSSKHHASNNIVVQTKSYSGATTEDVRICSILVFLFVLFVFFFSLFFSFSLCLI